MRKLFAVALLAGAALVGAHAPAPASASLLCTVNESGCSNESVYEKGEYFTTGAATKNFTFTTSSGNVVCAAEATGKITDMGGEGKAVKGELLGLGVGSCTFNNELPCGWAPKVNNLPYDAEFEGSGGNGSMALSDASAVSIGITCWAIECTFTAKKITFEVTGGSQAFLAAKNAPVGGTGAKCPATATLTAEFKTTSALHIVGGAAPSPGVRLCKVNADPCMSVFGGFVVRHPIGTTLEASLEGSSVFEFLYEGKQREPACEEGTWTGKTTAAGKPLIGEVSAMSFKKCGGGVCAVEAQNLGYKAEIEKTSGGNGTLALASGGGGSPRIEVNCGGAFKCIYKATSVSLAITGGSPAKLAPSQTLEKDAASGAECGSTMTWKATYKLTKPTGALFVTS
jgi:hypothetical protein